MENAGPRSACGERKFALWRGAMERPAHRRTEQYRTDHGPAARYQPEGDRRGQARLAGSRADRLADGAVQRTRLEVDLAAGRRHRRRWRRTELRLPARHERARYGR